MSSRGCVLWLSSYVRSAVHYTKYTLYCMMGCWRWLMLQRLIHLLAAFFIVILTGSVAVGQEPRRPGQETFISRAVFADGQLWLLSDAGDLWSIVEGKDEAVTIGLPEPALDLWIE